VSAVILTESKWTVSELARGISRPDEGAKSGRAYRYFLGDADSVDAKVTICARFLFVDRPSELFVTSLIHLRWDQPR
jgi:hypothetical protein